MDDNTNTETTNVCEPDAKPAADGTAPEPEPEPAPTPDEEHAESPMNLEEMVREAIDRRIAELFPPRREPPRVEAASGALLPEQRLRLGYGTREPNT